MIKIGDYNTLEVIKRTDKGYTLKSEKYVLLPHRHAPENLKVGENIKVFVYKESDEVFRATTEKPRAVVNEFAYLKVNDMTNFGMFLDWGVEKDLFVPKSQRKGNMIYGKSYVVRVCFDEETDRLYATNKIEKYLEKSNQDLVEGQEVDLLIYRMSEIGAMAIINNRYSGVIYHNENLEGVKVGQRVKGFVKKIRQDKKIDLTLQNLGQTSLSHKEQILNKLSEHDGFLPYHDKSHPEAIFSFFKMSKKNFKKAIGMLYKERKINLVEDGIMLAEME